MELDAESILPSTGTLMSNTSITKQRKMAGEPFSAHRDVSTCRPQTLTDDQLTDLHSSLQPWPRGSEQRNIHQMEPTDL